MKIKPYDHTYLEDVSDNLGTMLEYAFKCGFNPIVIWEIFASSVVAREIEMANPKYLAGYSGRDYLDILIDTGPTNEDKLLAKTSKSIGFSQSSPCSSYTRHFTRPISKNSSI